MCKEDRESFTKSKIVLITQLFKYLVCIDDEALKTHLEAVETENFRFLDYALQIMLAPMIHKLQVLVEDQDLERQLRTQCEKLLTRLSNGNLVDVVKTRLLA